jgi:signal transduction histidine kinase
MVLGFGFLFIVVMIVVVMATNFGIPFTAHSGSYGYERAQVLNKLGLIADLTKQSFLHWLDDLKVDPAELSESAVVKSLIQQLQGVVKTETARGATGDELRLALLTEGKSQAVTAKVKLLQNPSHGYQKIQVADAKTGIILFATDERLVGESVAAKPSFTSALESIADTSVVPEKDPLSSKAFLVFSHAISAPLLQTQGQEVVIAVAMLYVDTEAVVKPLLHPKAFGETSDVVLVDQAARILMPLKYPLADGTRATVLEHVIEAEPVRLSLRGEEGAVISTDYRGMPILAVYRHVNVTPGQVWGLVFKLDRSEMLGPLTERVAYSFVMALMGVVAVAAAALIIAGRIARPIENLNRVAQEVKRGNLSVRAPAVGSDEIGDLCAIFNSMIERIGNWHQELEQEVQARTAELRKANEDLAAEVTLRTETEKDLQLTLLELERSNSELQQFAYVASHDLQEPLRMISSYVQLLERRYKDKLDDDADEFISYAVDGAKRMQGLITDLLQLSRLGTRETSLAAVDCEAVLDQALANLQASIAECCAQVTHGPLPTVRADSTQLIQLFQNLVGNALKFRGTETQNIHVSAEPKNGKWLFSVRDNGIGINPEHSDRIFGIFQRLHGRGEYPGTGIGLAICKKIVEGHGGQIWVDSEPGKGATFFFTLPVGQP